MITHLSLRKYYWEMESVIFMRFLVKKTMIILLKEHHSSLTKYFAVL